MRVARLLAVVVSILAPAAAPPAIAQVTTGTLVGTVTDSGGVVPGATVTVRHVNRGTTTTFTTDPSGAYTAPFLVPGTYAVEVEMQGFKKWVRNDIVLEVNQRARVDALLEGGDGAGDRAPHRDLHGRVGAREGVRPQVAGEPVGQGGDLGGRAEVVQRAALLGDDEDVLLPLLRHPHQGLLPAGPEQLAGGAVT